MCHSRAMESYRESEDLHIVAKRLCMCVKMYDSKLTSSLLCDLIITLNCIASRCTVNLIHTHGQTTAPQ
jgi:hypothetical protein